MNLLQSKVSNSFDFFPKISNKSLPAKSTPFFYTDISIIKNRYRQIQTAFKNSWSGKSIIAYSFKTNYPTTKYLKKIGNLFAEVVSGMEYKKAKKINFSNSEIIYNGPYKEKLSKLLKLPLIINIDNFLELKKVIKYKKNIKANIGIRLNSNLKKSRFGFNIENGDAKQAINQLQKENLKIKGLHIHFGFYTSPKTYHQMAKKIIILIKENNLDLKYINFGGGFPSHGLKPYGFKKYKVSPINEYINQICSVFNSFFKNKSNKPKIIIEPGRFLVDDSTNLITRIINQQIKNNKQIITVDATNQMISSVWFRPQIVKPVFIKNHQQKINTIIYGGSCQEDDILYQGQFPIMKVNSLISFYCVGAYNQNMCTGFIYTKSKTYFNIANKTNKKQSF